MVEAFAGANGCKVCFLPSNVFVTGYTATICSFGSVRKTVAFCIVCTVVLLQDSCLRSEPSDDGHVLIVWCSLSVQEFGCVYESTQVV